MRTKLIKGILIIILLLISGCSNRSLDTFNEEKDQLVNENLELNKLISEKDKKINQLEEINTNKTVELRELKESLKMIRFSSYSRLDDYSDTFENLKNIYEINSNYEIKDDWYVIGDDYFQIELLEYNDAQRVEFYALRMESGEGPILIFSDTEPQDGWVYTNNNIGEIINKQTETSPRGFSYMPYFLIYAEVFMEDGQVIRTSKLPIYNK